jgi:hypothetical protein
MRPSGGSDIDGIPEDGLIILLFAALVLYRTLQFEKVVDDDPSPNYDCLILLKRSNEPKPYDDLSSPPPTRPTIPWIRQSRSVSAVAALNRIGVHGQKVIRSLGLGARVGDNHSLASPSNRREDSGLQDKLDVNLDIRRR